MFQGPNAGDAFNETFQRGLRERQAREMAHQQAQAAEAAAQAAKAQTDALQSQQQADELHKSQSLEAAKIVSAGDCAGGPPAKWPRAPGRPSDARVLKPS